MNSWNDFLQQVKEAENELKTENHNLWYRGHSDESWGLIPSVCREDNWEQKEKKLFNEFNISASRLFEKRTNDWETLFDMQHYWIPTRLLDWTSVMGVAIAFILHSDYRNVDNSALFILNPLKLNQISGRNEVINIPADNKFNYKEIYWDNLPTKLEKPLAIQPVHNSDRIHAQKGTFTVHGSDIDGFENFATDCFKKIILTKDAKDEAKDFLLWANLDEYTIYPDIVGMAQHIKRKILGV